MSEEDPKACAEPEEPKAGPPPEKTSDWYRVSEDLPARFNNPAWFRGYRTKEPPSVYRTSNQAYGSRAPTVHEMPCRGLGFSPACPNPGAHAAQLEALRTTPPEVRPEAAA
ncbi:UPF0691 protein C9orf116 homolog isoform X3 [Bos indicus x Bos taurus]|uniref:piercer of microtubule wall 1 protein isoform X2 n=1 Tax=Bos taurus TaxID=9913 RepID=UPI000572D43B|nr:piercer of microtubule wall 1 protein isoform X2 [Bos taurus]XP_027412696.1 UPF0691 protein C9orf116 homolog isoform X3 [Bos indicus x Bos taurus]XP_061290160.1 piercer of microtubule wall 1 protein isoform X3 [Bos javanicus]